MSAAVFFELQPAAALREETSLAHLRQMAYIVLRSH